MNSLTIDTEEQLESLLSEPTPEVIETMGRLEGDLLLLGVAGKMGPTLARMAKRASDAAGVRRRIIGVSRFSTGGEAALRAHGIETVRCDLLNEEEVAGLPDVPNVILMTGRKFGSTGDEATTWAMNSYLPGVVCRKYRGSRMVAFSTGNVYDLATVASGGSREDDTLQPVGEYAMSCVGRERLLEYSSRLYGIPMLILRLNYACELRYGVLVDLAQRVWSGQTIDVSMGYLNTIWQGDANAMTLRGFAHLATPPRVLNMTGPELLSVRTVCERLGQLLHKPVSFTGTEAATAVLSNAQNGLKLLGSPRISASQLLEGVAHWIAHGGSSLGKPTHFEARDGRF